MLSTSASPVNNNLQDKISIIREKLLSVFPDQDSRTNEFIKLYNKKLDEIQTSKDDIDDSDLVFLNERTVDFAKELLDLKDDNGDYFIDDPRDINFILEYTDQDLFTNSFKEFITLKDDSNNYIFRDFDGFDVNSFNDAMIILSKENIDIAKKLLLLKNENGKFAVSPQDLWYLLKCDPSILQELLPIKTDDGFHRLGFDTRNFGSVSKKLTDDNLDIAKLLFEKKYYNSFAFENNEISNILECTTDKNQDVLKSVLNREIDRGTQTTDIITEIISSVTPENKEFVVELLNSRDDNSNYRYGLDQISDIVRYVNSENINFVKELAKSNDDNGFPLLSGNTRLFRYLDINNDNFDIVKKMLTLKNQYGKKVFNSFDFERLGKFLRPEDYDFLDNLLEIKDNNGFYSFSASQTLDILHSTDKNNRPLFLQLSELKENNGKLRFSVYELIKIITFVECEDTDFALNLLRMKNEDSSYRFSVDGIKTFLTIYSDQKDLIYNLSCMKDTKGNYRFSESDIQLIAEKFNDIEEDVASDILSLLLSKKDNNGDYKFSGSQLSWLFSTILECNNFDYVYSLIEQSESDSEMTPACICALASYEYYFSVEDIKYLESVIGKSVVNNLSIDELSIMAELKDYVNINNINEISIENKKRLLRNLVDTNALLFEYSDNIKKYLPILPENKEEYCTLLPLLAKSVGIQTNKLSQTQIQAVNKNLLSLSQTLSQIDDNDFLNLSVSQEYSSNEFIKDVFNIVKNTDPSERQKVYDYFGFELVKNQCGTQADDNPENCFSIYGYPVNLNNAEELTKIENPVTKQIIRRLEPYVIKFSENNPIICNNSSVEKILNDLISDFPELRSQIGRKQHSEHDFDLFKHSLKVMQKISQSDEFGSLSDSDKRIMLLASLFHDSAKAEGLTDVSHASESAFDSYYILQKMNLSKDELNKLYSLLNHHEWFAYVNNKHADDTVKRLQDVAFDHQYDNLFELAKIFTAADLKAVKVDDSFFKKFADDFETAKNAVETNIYELKKSQPLFPVTKIPSASVIDKSLTFVNPDGSTNIKGVYKDNGLTVLKFNEIEDWEAIGFPKGSTSQGIEAEGFSQHDNDIHQSSVNTGNIKFFVHALDNPDQLIKFDAFSLPDSDALLSASYAERPESKYRFFRPQGVILNVDNKYTYGGGETDAGSGCAKNIQNFKNNYVFGGERESDRLFISNLIKNTLNLSDDDYIEFVKKYKNKSFTEIQPPEIREKLIKAFASIKSNVRLHDREYNEMYISNPDVMGVFAYNENQGEKIDSVPEFMSGQKDFLKKYALEKDIPYFIFGD